MSASPLVDRAPPLVRGAVVAHFQDAPDMLTPLLVITGVLAVYGVYAPLVGYLNGRRMFGRQAALNVAAAILRTSCMLGFGFFFVKKMDVMARGLGTTPGVLGATFGAVFASAGVLMLAPRVDAAPARRSPARGPRACRVRASTSASSRR